MKAFENVKGYDSLKNELMEIIDIMQNKDVYEALNASCPNGLLLYGAPGVGKTLIAKGFIEASGRPAVVCRKNASDQSFIDSIGEAFNEAVKKSPSIILLDDMDKFANDDDDHCDSEAYVTIQSCIDEVKGKDVFVVATVNNVRKLPRSLIRTGRFDRRIEVERPNDADSRKIIEHYLRGKGLDDDVDVSMLSAFFRGASCSTLETVINQAGINAGFKRADSVSMRDLIEAYIQTTHDVSKEELRTPVDLNLDADDSRAEVVWHEAGHIAVAELLVPGSVSVALAIPRAIGGNGFTSNGMLEATGSDLSRRKNDILISLAGAAATDVVFGRLDEGSSCDVKRALSDIMDVIGVGGFSGLGMAVSDYPSNDLDARREIAASAIAELYYQEAKELLCSNRAFLEAVAKALAEKVVLTSIDVAEIRKSLDI